MPASADSTRPHVLLVSAQGNWAGLLRLPYMLRRAGARVSMFGPERSRLRHSMYVERIIPAPKAIGEFIAALREHLATHQYAWVVIGDDPTLVAIGQQAAKDGGEWVDGWFPVDHTKGLEMIFSKTLFAEACPRFDVPIPRSLVCNTFDDVDRAAKQIGYPLMLKTAIGQAGNGVLRVDKHEDLVEAFDQFKHRAPLVLQEFVVGRIGSTQMMFDHGKPICWVPAYKSVCFPEPFGPSCVRELLEDAGVTAMKPIVENVGRMTGFHGMCGIDWIRRADGSFAILEFNPRPTSTIHIGRLVGADCATALRAMFAGGAAPQIPAGVARADEQVYMFPQHLQRCIRYNEYKQILRWLPGMGHHDVPWHEPKLMLADLWSLTRLVGRRIWQNIAGNTATSRTKPAPEPAHISIDEDIVAGT